MGSTIIRTRRADGAGRGVTEFASVEVWALTISPPDSEPSNQLREIEKRPENSLHLQNNIAAEYVQPTSAKLENIPLNFVPSDTPGALLPSRTSYGQTPVSLSKPHLHRRGIHALRLGPSCGALSAERTRKKHR